MPEHSENCTKDGPSIQWTLSVLVNMARVCRPFSSAISHGERFLEVERASFDEDGQLMELVSSYLNPDHCSLHIEFGRLNNETSSIQIPDRALGTLSDLSLGDALVCLTKHE